MDQKEQFDVGPCDSISSLQGSRYKIITPGGGPFVARVVAEVPRFQDAYRIRDALNAAVGAAELEAALASILSVAPRLTKVHQWTGVDAAEDLFDMELRHKSGMTPYDYLKTWLNMLRPFAYATQDDSWGEMEKLLCIVMRNYVRVAAAADRARPLVAEAAS